MGWLILFGLTTVNPYIGSVSVLVYVRSHSLFICLFTVSFDDVESYTMAAFRLRNVLKRFNMKAEIDAPD